MADHTLQDAGHGGHGEHESHPRFQHQFDDMGQQQAASGLGMWMFLVQEIMFFGGLFIAYLVYRHKFFDAFSAASITLNWRLGFFNTIVLIGSSLTMALAVNAAQRGLKKRLIFFILSTMFLGTVFLGVKVIEYHDKYVENHIPGANFCFHDSQEPCMDNEGKPQKEEEEWLSEARKEKPGMANPSAMAGMAGNLEMAPQGHSAPDEATIANKSASPRDRSMSGSELYFSLYFAMTGMHALHMVIGMGLMVWLLLQAYKGVYDEKYFTPVENFGLYWHFVDIVWIYLFPLLYLINGVSK